MTSLQIQSVGPIPIPSGQKVINATISPTNAIGSVISATLLTGDNAVTVPTGATACVICPPSNNVSVVTLKGAVGDTGIILLATSPSCISLDPTVTTFLLHLSATSAGWEITFI